jgi:malonate transporter
VNYAQLLFPDFSLIVCGYLVCRYTALNRTVWEKVESLVYYFLFPVLLFQSIVRSPLDLGAASSLIGAGLLLGVAASPWPTACPPALAAPPHRCARTRRRAQVAFRFNSFIALALADRLAGAQGLQLIAVLIGVCVPLFNVARSGPWPARAARLPGRAGAQPADHGHGHGLAANLLGFRCPSGWNPP